MNINEALERFEIADAAHVQAENELMAWHRKIAPRLMDVGGFRRRLWDRVYPRAHEIKSAGFRLEVVRAIYDAGAYAQLDKMNAAIRPLKEERRRLEQIEKQCREDKRHAEIDLKNATADPHL